MTFKDFLVEDAGNLKSIPTKLLKQLTSSYRTLAGRDSDIELWKSNVKQKDVTAITKKVAGYVKDSDRGYRTSSSEEKKAKQFKNKYAGALLKINGEWTHYISWEEYSGYYLLKADGNYETVTKHRSAARRSWAYQANDLKPNDIGEKIDFKENNVDIYLVTVDQKRVEKRKERSELHKTPAVSKEQIAARIKYMKKKTSDVSKSLVSRLNKTLESLNSKVKKSIDNAVDGNYEPTDISKELSTISELKRDLDDINQRISHFVNHEGVSIRDRELPYSMKWDLESIQKIIDDFE